MDGDIHEPDVPAHPADTATSATPGQPDLRTPESGVIDSASAQHPVQSAASHGRRTLPAGADATANHPGDPRSQPHPGTTTASHSPEHTPETASPQTPPTAPHADGVHASHGCRESPPATMDEILRAHSADTAPSNSTTKTTVYDHIDAALASGRASSVTITADPDGGLIITLRPPQAPLPTHTRAGATQPSPAGTPPPDTWAGRARRAADAPAAPPWKGAPSRGTSPTEDEFERAEPPTLSLGSNRPLIDGKHISFVDSALDGVTHAMRPAAHRFDGKGGVPVTDVGAGATIVQADSRSAVKWLVGSGGPSAPMPIAEAQAICLAEGFVAFHRSCISAADRQEGRTTHDKHGRLQFTSEGAQRFANAHLNLRDRNVVLIPMASPIKMARKHRSPACQDHSDSRWRGQVARRSDPQPNLPPRRRPSAAPQRRAVSRGPAVVSRGARLRQHLLTLPHPAHGCPPPRVPRRRTNQSASHGGDHRVPSLAPQASRRAPPPVPPPCGDAPVHSGGNGAPANLYTPATARYWPINDHPRRS
jgi:hypothetical protein